MRDKHEPRALDAAEGAAPDVENMPGDRNVTHSPDIKGGLPDGNGGIAAAPPVCALHRGDFLAHAARVPDSSVDLVLADPPYGLGKDYGNDSDKLSGPEHLAWTRTWLDRVMPKLKRSGSLYIFCTWQYAPEIFSYLKTRLIMVNEIIWDRRVPSMGGSTRRFTSVHDNIGLFAMSRDYYFDLDPVRIPYDPATKKARTRRLFAGSKWLEVGYNPKDVWSVSRLHRQHGERVAHPTQKPLEIVERMVLASCPPGGLVLDPFMGSGTTAVACARHGRRFVGYEINADYCALARARVAAVTSAASMPPVRSRAPGSSSSTSETIEDVPH